MKPHLEFGYVCRVHGLHGEVGVRTFDPGSTVLEEIERVWIRERGGAERELEISQVREGSQGDLLVRFSGVGTREAADALKGSTLMAWREDLEPPDEGEYFQGDLVGLSAVTAEGEELGKIVEMFVGGPVPNLVIRGGARGELMIPFVDEFVTAVDVEGGKVTVIPLVFDE